MCGFVGVVRAGARAVTRSELEALLPLVARRGPDGSGVVTDGGFGVAAARLAVQGGHEADQPLRSPDGRFVIAYNGELFSSHRRALRQAMRAEGAGEARATSDTALLLAWLATRLYARRPGDPVAADLLQPLSGAMYAFALFDLAVREAFLCADGAVKPLYALSVPSAGETWFASTMAPLWAVKPGPRVLDREELARRLFTPDGSRSLVQADGLLTAVRGALDPIGERGDSHPASRRAHAPRRSHGRDGALHGETDASTLREAWADAAREAVEVSGPVSIFLSGGLDSAAVAAWCDRSDLLAITGRFGPPGGPFDESADAASMAKALGLDHEIVDLTDADLLTDLPSVIQALEEPIGGPGSLALYRLAIHAKAHGRVALSGTGGDEMLGGYARVALSLGRSGRWTKGYEPLAERMAAAGKDPHARWLAALDRSDDLLPYFTEDFRASLPLADAREFARGRVIPPGASSRPWTARDLARAEAETTLRMLLEVEDRVTMWHGIESRPVPSLGRVRAVAASLPDDWLVSKDGEGKRALRECLKGAIPEAVRTNPVKRGFPTPFHRAATGAGRSVAEGMLVDRRFVERGWWDVGACRRLLEGERPAHDRALFSVLSLEMFARLFLDGDALVRASVRSP